MKRIFFLSLFLAALFSFDAFGAFTIGINTGYHSDSDGSTKYTFNNMTNHFFIGASLGSRDQFYLGQNITKQTTQYKTSTTLKISTLELGPRFTYYFNAEKTILITLGWNPYAKGTRTTLAGATQDISGSSILAGLGYEIKMNSNIYLGASLMYHALSVSKYEVNNASTEVSESYTSLAPMINLNFRFR